MITVRVNGKEEELREPLSMQAFLQEKGYRTGRIAVEKNGGIVPKSAYEDVFIEDGDTLEVVSFVGGG